MFTIDKNIPVPSKANKSYRYPIYEMQVGDSFFVPNTTINKINTALKYHTHKSKFQITCRTVIENDIKGVRVWRVK